VPVGQRCVARYDALVADPASEIAHICAAIGFGWDRALEGGLPLANHTVSAPRVDKWRARESEIAPVLPALAATIERAAAFATR